MGRPLGSKNKVQRGPGRPTGSTNKRPGRPKGSTNKRGPGRPPGSGNNAGKGAKPSKDEKIAAIEAEMTAASLNRAGDIFTEYSAEEITHAYMTLRTKKSLPATVARYLERLDPDEAAMIEEKMLANA